MKRNFSNNYNSKAIIDSGMTCDNYEFDENISFLWKIFGTMMIMTIQFT